MGIKNFETHPASVVALLGESATAHKVTSIEPREPAPHSDQVRGKPWNEAQEERAIQTLRVVRPSARARLVDLYHGPEPAKGRLPIVLLLVSQWRPHNNGRIKVNSWIGGLRMAHYKVDYTGDMDTTHRP